MLFVALVLALLSAAARGALFVQYFSAADTTIGMRTAVGGTCKDMYATERVAADSEFLFREMPALDGSSGVSLMPAVNNGYYVCDDGTGRLVVVNPALSAAQCTFKKVPGLSNPSHVSFQQGTRYIGYAKAYDYDCSGWFTGKKGWTIALVDKPTTVKLLTQATWVTVSNTVSVTIYVQDTSNWLYTCNGRAVFSSKRADVWDFVPALDTSAPSTAISLRSHTDTSLYLGIDNDGAGQLSSATAVPVKTWNCAGSPSHCTWTFGISIRAGDVHLTHVASGRTVGLTNLTDSPSCAGADGYTGGGDLYKSLAADLGFLRSNYAAPNMPAVIINNSASGSSSSSRVHVPSCSDYTLCRTCTTTELSCGWCEETQVCTRGSAGVPVNCPASKWFFDSCVAATKNDDNGVSLVGPLVGGIVGGVAVLSAVAVIAVVVARAVHKRKPAVLNVPVEGVSIDFVSANVATSGGFSASPLTPPVYSGSSAATCLGMQSGSSGPVMPLPVDINTTFDMKLSIPPMSPGGLSLEMMSQGALPPSYAQVQYAMSRSSSSGTPGSQ
eukprot:m51a1_g14016 hypothetical protein (554) ;mRNA; f:1099296-1101195